MTEFFQRPTFLHGYGPDGADSHLLALFFWVIGLLLCRRLVVLPDGLQDWADCFALCCLSFPLRRALSLFELGRQAGEAANVLAVSIDFVGPVLKSLIPATVNALAILLALFLLAFGRRRLTLFTALVCVWIAGTSF